MTCSPRTWANTRAHTGSHPSLADSAFDRHRRDLIIARNVGGDPRLPVTQLALVRAGAQIDQPARCTRKPPCANPSRLVRGVVLDDLFDLDMAGGCRAGSAKVRPRRPALRRVHRGGDHCCGGGSWLAGRTAAAAGSARAAGRPAARWPLTVAPGSPTAAPRDRSGCGGPRGLGAGPAAGSGLAWCAGVSASASVPAACGAGSGRRPELEPRRVGRTHTEPAAVVTCGGCGAPGLGHPQIRQRHLLGASSVPARHARGARGFPAAGSAT